MPLRQLITLGLAECRPPTRTRLGLHPITISSSRERKRHVWDDGMNRSTVQWLWCSYLLTRCLALIPHWSGRGPCCQTKNLTISALLVRKPFERSRTFLLSTVWSIHGNLLRGRQIFQFNRSVFNLLPLIMPLYVNVLASGMGFQVFSQRDCALVITIDDDSFDSSIETMIRWWGGDLLLCWIFW